MTVRMPGVVCLDTGSMAAPKVFAGLTEKYSMPVPVCSPSETVTSMAALPDVIEPASNVNCPSARVETLTWSVFRAVADTNVSGSPSGSVKLPNALVVWVAPCSTSISGGMSVCVGAPFPSSDKVSVTFASEVCPRPSEIP